MLEIKNIFDQISRKIFLTLLVSLVLLLSLPAASVQAAGYYSEKTHKVEVVKPFYSTKERKIVRNEVVRPFYSTQERRKEKVYTTPASGDDYIESGKRAGEVIPKDLGTGSRQKNPVNMLKRAGEELGNEPLKRSFGANDYERSQIEQELAKNKAARGDVE